MALSYLQQASSTSDLNSYTFSSQNLGAASADRYIIVSIQTRDSGTGAKTINSVTVGGVSATITVQKQGVDAATNSTVAGLAIALVPSGTTGDVVVTFSEVVLRCSIALYAATGLTSATPTDTGSSNASNPTYDIDVAAGGFAIGAISDANGTSVVWTGITENFDTTVETFLLVSGAAATFATQQTNLTLTATITGTADNPAGVFASWQQSAVKKVSGVSRVSIKKLSPVAAASIKKVATIAN